MRNRVERLAALHGGRTTPAPVGAEEGIALRVEARERLGAGEVGEVIAALSVLGLVVDDAVFDLDLSGGEIALEVGLVVPGIPETELDRGEERQLRFAVALVRDPRAPDLEVLLDRNEVQRLGLDAVVARGDRRVAHAVPALVVLELRLRRLPGRRPELARTGVAQVQVAPAQIEGSAVVVVAREPAQSGVSVERVAAGGVRDDPEIGFASQIVDPRKWRVRARDHILASFIVKVSVAHPLSIPSIGSA